MSNRLPQALANLDAWLQTMRQPGGYGGPVAHWWRDQFVYTGPGLDWRYEGILIGYSELWDKTQEVQWLARLKQAAEDLKSGQLSDGSYRMSRFEQNPGTLGTPHEAAASLGLLTAMERTGDLTLLATARANLDNLIHRLWDPTTHGFTDKPGVPGRVPNKLATFSQALCLLAHLTQDDQYLEYAKIAIDDVLRFQIDRGRFQGAVHQYAPDNQHGDHRLFPYYNARCINPLLTAAKVFSDPTYSQAAARIMDFLRQTMADDGSWPQIVYTSGRRVDYPRWLAGTADILYAFHRIGEPLPARALDRLLASQLPSGAFPTAIGFGRKTHRHAPLDPPDYRDLIPVVGWNDKVLRLLAARLPPATTLPPPNIQPYSRPARITAKDTVFTETIQMFQYGSDYTVSKSAPWAKGEILWG
ncbi:MAG: hypothetical protein OWR62_14850 [Sulfobacillus thermotolerans]|nr:hypothetical protein [Sulfobacillus thermotolerans]